MSANPATDAQLPKHHHSVEPASAGKWRRRRPSLAGARTLTTRPSTSSSDRTELGCCMIRRTIEAVATSRAVGLSFRAIARALSDSLFWMNRLARKLHLALSKRHDGTSGDNSNTIAIGRPLTSRFRPRRGAEGHGEPLCTPLLAHRKLPQNRTRTLHRQLAHHLPQQWRSCAGAMSGFSRVIEQYVPELHPHGRNRYQCHCGRAQAHKKANRSRCLTQARVESLLPAHAFVQSRSGTQRLRANRACCVGWAFPCRPNPRSRCHRFCAERCTCFAKSSQEQCPGGAVHCDFGEVTTTSPLRFHLLAEHANCW